MSDINKMSSLRTMMFAALLATALVTFSKATAQVTTIDDPALSERIMLPASGQPVSGEVFVAAGQSQVLQFSAPIGHSLVADPDVADIVPMSDQSLYLLGKEKGLTTLTLFDSARKLRGVFKVNVTHDLDALKRSLYELAPNEDIQVRSNGDSVVLSGAASSPAVATMARQLAEQHGITSVMNAVDTGASKQVMLKVKIAEVQRSVSKRMNLSSGSSLQPSYPGEGQSLLFNSGILDIESFATGMATARIGEFDFSLFYDALEEKGLITTLAEPNLVAMNGETAYFLAGGEFPIPTRSQSVEGGAQIQIEFKEFGVKLAYTPTVIGDKINMVVEPEVSSLDPANGIVLDFITIPALITRRASTTVELKNGQSFVIAGLLQDRFESEIKGIPGLAGIPILGALARSPSYARNETELMIIITPYFVEPYEGSDYALPNDFAKHPSETDLFLGGKVESGR